MHIIILDAEGFAVMLITLHCKINRLDSKLMPGYAECVCVVYILLLCIKNQISCFIVLS